MNLLKKTAPDNHFVVEYYLEAKTSLMDAAWNIAVGQSIGNPNNRSIWETEEMYQNHSCFCLLYTSDAADE